MGAGRQEHKLADEPKRDGDDETPSAEGTEPPEEAGVQPSESPTDNERCEKAEHRELGERAER